MKPLSFISPEFSAKSSNHYNLLLQCGACGIAICVFDTEHEKFIALKYNLYSGKVNDYNDYSKYAGRLIKEEYLLHLPYKQIRCMCPTQCYSIAPAKRLPQHYKAQLEKEHSLNDLDEIHCCAIENIDAECIFTVPAPLSAKLFEQMGTITYAHQSIPLIHNTMQNAADGIAVMTIAMTADFINIALCSGGNYDYKTFNVGAPQDMIYYILLVIKQLEVDSNNLKILVAAEMENSYQAELDSFFDNILRVKVQESYCAAGLHSYVNPNFDLLFMLQQCG